MFRRLLYLAFFLSGFSALVYELIWTRKLALIFGNTPYAVSTVLAIFFGGLAIGSWLVGRILKNSKLEARISKKARKTKIQMRERDFLFRILNLSRVLGIGFRIFTIYSIIELGIGLLALATLPLIPLIDHLPFSPTLSPSTIITIILATIPVLLPPTILIGTTLPVMVVLMRSIRPTMDGQRNETLGKTTAKIYAVNTAGGVFGVFLTAFFLIALLGVNQTLILAGAVNITIGLTLPFLSHKIGVNRSLALSQSHRPRSVAAHLGEEALFAMTKKLRRQKIWVNKRLLLGAFFLSGAAALALEVLLTRSLILSFGSSTYSFATILSTFLFGIALGSTLATRWLGERRRKMRQRNPLNIFAICLVTICIVVLVITPVIGNLPLILLRFVSEESSFIYIQSLIFLLSFTLLAPATIFMGATFPLVVDAYQKSKVKSQKSKLPEIESIGSLYAVNTFGGIIGALAAGFILISTLGVQKSIIATAIVYLLTGSFLFWQQTKKAKRAVLTFVTFTIIIIAFLIPSWNKKIVTLGSFVYFPKLKLQPQAEMRSQISGRELLFFKDGLTANIAVYEEEKDRFLRINGKTDASTIGDLESELLIGHLPMLLAKQLRNVMVIGFGAGISLGAVETYPAQNIDMVEIEPAVIEASSFFKDANHDALADPRVNLVINDARNFLFKSNKTYDVITSEPSNPWVSGIANLYTVEFFEEVRKHLEDDGIALQWLHLYSLSPADVRTIFRTFSTVFPYVSGWIPLQSKDLLLIGSKKEHATTLSQIEKAFGHPKVRKDLLRIGVTKPSSLMHHYLLNKESIRQIAEDGQLHTDNHPILEFSAPKSLWLNTLVDNLSLLFKYRAKDLSSILIDGVINEELTRELLIRDSILSAAIVAEDDLDQAISFAAGAFSLNPEIPQMRTFLADMYFDKAQEFFTNKKTNDAARYLVKTIGLTPNHTLAHANLGAIYLNAGLLDEAKTELDEAIRISPNRTEPHINLALYYQQIGEFGKAKEELKKTLELDPQNSQAQNLLGRG